MDVKLICGQNLQRRSSRMFGGDAAGAENQQLGQAERTNVFPLDKGGAMFRGLLAKRCAVFKRTSAMTTLQTLAKTRHETLANIGTIVPFPSICSNLLFKYKLQNDKNSNVLSRRKYWGTKKACPAALTLWDKSTFATRRSVSSGSWSSHKVILGGTGGPINKFKERRSKTPLSHGGRAPDWLHVSSNCRSRPELAAQARTCEQGEVCSRQTCPLRALIVVWKRDSKVINRVACYDVLSGDARIFDAFCLQSWIFQL